mgnify:CR=1 FL=1
MRENTCILLILALFTSCTDFFVFLYPDKNWLLIEKGPVKLYYKPQNISNTPSPTEEQAKKILNNQLYYYEAIQDSIGKAFDDPILVYLYNKDQAQEKIGTATGGMAQSRYLTIYYSFIYDIGPYRDKYGIENAFVGAHEMVHVITHHLLGNPGTKLMSEGYAVWLDGSYARNNINTYISKFREEYPQHLLSPTELLNESVEDEMIYYPNAGVFTRYLVKNYGIENINRLFSVSKENFKKKFEKLANKTWEEMEENYQIYLNNL